MLCKIVFFIIIIPASVVHVCVSLSCKAKREVPSNLNNAASVLFEYNVPAIGAETGIVLIGIRTFGNLRQGLSLVVVHHVDVRGRCPFQSSTECNAVYYGIVGRRTVVVPTAGFLRRSI